ncbi:MAG: glycerophosphodiester phosphodiesterase family protein [Eubacteriales bacterium]
MKKIFLLLIAVLSIICLYVSCFDGLDTDISDIEDLPNDGEGISIKILHAGGAYDGKSYLNAQEAFDYYYSQGYRYFEYDLKLSSDGRLIATHDFEYLPISDGNITYEEFTALKLEGGLTPVNEQWLINTITAHTDVRIVVDAKMDTREGDVAVLKRIEELESIYGIDVSANIIPEIFSIEMWEDVQTCTTFDYYFFSHYKEYYSVDTILEHFSSPKILGVAIPTWTDNYIKSNLYKIKDAGKKLFVFTVMNDEHLAFAEEIGADGIYIDGIDIDE